jgi:cytochrome c biogenesis protein CcdA
MGELFVSFFAGVLTVAAPCVLPILPVIIGGTAAANLEKKHSLLSPTVVILGLVTSIILFSLVLKASTTLLGVPQLVWQSISAGIILIFGLHFLFPTIWANLSTKLNLQQGSDALLEKTSHKRGIAGDFLMGAALGPVFNSCSPTYALIVAIILPRSFGEGLAHLTAYALGLGLILFAVAVLGRSVTQKLRVFANPNGWFRKTVGILFILVALLLITGYDKKFQTYVLENGWYDPISSFENGLKN